MIHSYPHLFRTYLAVPLHCAGIRMIAHPAILIGLISLTTIPAIAQETTLPQRTEYSSSAISALPLDSLVFSSDTLFFPTVVLRDTRGKGASLTNKRNEDISIVSATSSAPVDFTLNGPQGFSLSPDSSQSFSVTFSPQTHNPPLGLHSGDITFTLSDGTWGKLYLVGYDHEPIRDTLSIAKTYWASAGQQIAVSVELTGSLAGVLDPITSFECFIRYDPKLDLVRVQNGALTPNWGIQPTPKSPGNLQIQASSNGISLSGPGELLQLLFYVDSSAQVFDSYMMTVDSPRFGAGFEPLLGTSPGLLRVKNGCAPVFLSNGMPGTSIEQNTPNPFSTSTRITYYVGKSDGPLTAVRLSLYDPLGKEVRRLCETDESPGAHVVILDASSLTAGVYTYRFDCGKRHEVRSLVVTK